MTNLPPDDRQWQEFLRKNHPIPPPAAPEMEEQLMKAVEQCPQPSISQRLWPWPPALVAGLLMLWSSYRLLNPVPASSQAASVETFLQDNWNEVIGDTYPNTPRNQVVPVDWRFEATAVR